MAGIDESRALWHSLSQPSEVLKKDQYATARCIANKHDLLLPTLEELSRDLLDASSHRDIRQLCQSLENQTRPRLDRTIDSTLSPSEEWRRCERQWRQISICLRLSFWRLRPDTFVSSIATNLTSQCARVFTTLESKATQTQEMLDCSLQVLEVWSLLLLTGSTEADEQCQRASLWYVRVLEEHYISKTPSTSQKARRVIERVWDFFSSVILRTPRTQELEQHITVLETVMFHVLRDELRLPDQPPKASKSSILLAAHILAKLYGHRGCDRGRSWRKTMTLLDQARAWVDDHNLQVFPSTWVDAVFPLVLRLIQFEFVWIPPPRDRSTSGEISYFSGPPDSQMVATSLPLESTRVMPSCCRVDSNTNYLGPGSASSRVRPHPGLSSVFNNINAKLQEVVNRLTGMCSMFELGKDLKFFVLLESVVKTLGHRLSAPEWPASNLLFVSISQLLKSLTSKAIIRSRDQSRTIEIWTLMGDALLQSVVLDPCPKERSILFNEATNFGKHKAVEEFMTARDQGLLHRAAVHSIKALLISGRCNVVEAMSEGMRYCQLREQGSMALLGEVITTLQMHHKSPDHTVRAHAMESLRKLAKRQPALIQHSSMDIDRILMCAHDRDVSVRKSFLRFLLRSLWHSRHLTDVVLLALEHLEDEDIDVRQRVLRWLSQQLQFIDLQNEHLRVRVALTLFSCMRHESNETCEKAVDLLQNLWNPRSIAPTVLARQMQLCFALDPVNIATTWVVFMKTCLSSGATSLWRKFLTDLAANTLKRMCTEPNPSTSCAMIKSVTDVDPSLVRPAQLQALFELCTQRYKPAYRRLFETVRGICLQVLLDWSDFKDIWAMIDLLLKPNSLASSTLPITAFIDKVIKELQASKTWEEVQIPRLLTLISIVGACVANDNFDQYSHTLQSCEPVLPGVSRRHALVMLLTLYAAEPQPPMIHDVAIKNLRLMYQTRLSLLQETGIVGPLIDPLHVPGGYSDLDTRQQDDLVVTLQFWHKIVLDTLQASAAPPFSGTDRMDLSDVRAAVDFRALSVLIGGRILPLTRSLAFCGAMAAADPAVRLIGAIAQMDNVFAPQSVAILMVASCHRPLAPIALSALDPLWKNDHESTFSDAWSMIDENAWLLAGEKVQGRKDGMKRAFEARLNPCWQAMCTNAKSTTVFELLDVLVASLKVAATRGDSTVLSWAQFVIHNLSRFTYSCEIDVQYSLTKLEELRKHLQKSCTSSDASLRCLASPLPSQPERVVQAADNERLALKFESSPVQQSTRILQLLLDGIEHLRRRYGHSGPRSLEAKCDAVLMKSQEVLPEPPGLDRRVRVTTDPALCAIVCSEPSRSGATCPPLMTSLGDNVLKERASHQAPHRGSTLLSRSGTTSEIVRRQPSRRAKRKYVRDDIKAAPKVKSCSASQGLRRSRRISNQQKSTSVQDGFQRDHHACCRKKRRTV